VEVGAAEKVFAALGAAGISIERQHRERGAVREVKVEIAGELERAAEVNAGGDFHEAATGLARGVDRGLERSRVVGRAVALRAVVTDVELPVGDFGRSGLIAGRVSAASESEKRREVVATSV